VSPTLTGYSLQNEIIGLLVIAIVLAVCGYSMMCKQSKDNEKYMAIKDQTNI